MEIVKTKLDGVVIVNPTVHGDNRGWFMESYSKLKFDDLGIDVEFIQDNHSYSKEKGTIRGLHFQKNPKAQAKLIRCTRGKILDVAVDIREGSPTYKQYVAIELSEENKKQLLIPKGFAHGFVTLTDNVEIQYKVDEYYAPKFDRSIYYADKEIGIDWGTENPIISQKDLEALKLKEVDNDFKY